MCSFEKQAFDLLKTLEKRPNVCDVQTSNNTPVTPSNLNLWEQKHSCVLPEDLKQFYLTTNGFSVRWNVKINPDMSIPVGRIEINQISKLNKVAFGPVSASRDHSGLPAITDLHLDSDDEVHDSAERPAKPKFDHRSRAFELEPCDGYCKVCLVYRNTKLGVTAQAAEIWLLDRSLRWHFLAENFIQYYCQLMIYLGLPQWQFAFTDIGLLPQVKQWFNLLCPTRIEDGNDDVVLDMAAGSQASPLDVNKVFKGKSDKKKVIGSQIVKKKPTLPLASITKPGSGKSSTSSMQPPPVTKPNVRT